MLVNSVVFLFFFLIVLTPYFGVMRKNVGVQNFWVVIASYFFYGWADWRMLPLLFGATIVFYCLSLALYRKEGTSSTKSKISRKIFFIVGIFFSVGGLLYFKYTNFLLGPLGVHVNLIVPVGISFFTFKLLAYLIEVKRGNIEVEEDFIKFAAYIAFFPTIMSGPIDKPNDFLPQLHTSRKWNDGMVLEGCKRVLWGMFLKMCIADKLSSYTDAVFNNYYHHSGLTISVAAVMYTFQIYADFCGYSEMAIGVGRIMGFRITENFRRPYFSTNVGEFWRRWHMSLMAWLREYVYFPLGGSRCSEVKTMRNTMATFLVSGLWHGANWTFIVWGAYHGLLVFLYRFWNKIAGKNRETRTLGRYFSILLVFLLSTIGWAMFRADSVAHFMGIVSRLTASGGLFFSWALTAALPIAIMLFKELKDEEGWNIHLLHSRNLYVQAVSIGLLIVYVFYTGELNGAQFIYFQF